MLLLESHVPSSRSLKRSCSCSYSRIDGDTTYLFYFQANLKRFEALVLPQAADCPVMKSAAIRYRECPDGEVGDVQDLAWGQGRRAQSCRTLTLRQSLPGGCLSSPTSRLRHTTYLMPPNRNSEILTCGLLWIFLMNNRIKRHYKISNNSMVINSLLRDNSIRRISSRIINISGRTKRNPFSFQQIKSHRIYWIRFYGLVSFSQP